MNVELSPNIPFSVRVPAASGGTGGTAPIRSGSADGVAEQVTSLTQPSAAVATGGSGSASPALAKLPIESGLKDRKLEFKTDQQTGELSIRVVNRETGELIRQIPAEDLARFSRRFRELLGIVFDRQA